MHNGSTFAVAALCLFCLFLALAADLGYGDSLKKNKTEPSTMAELIKETNEIGF